jgi:glycosyltransferase involved in cell wall biosynthesis
MPVDSGLRIPRGAPARRVAIVVQRFGVEINGGAELHAMQLARRLASTMDVEVLTSCARDYTDWALFYEPGVSTVAGLTVRRFTHPTRNPSGQRARVPLMHKLRFLGRRWLRRLPSALVLQPRGEPDYDGRTFLHRQGPYCPDLFEHLRTSADRYDAVIFFAALYAPAALGILAWGRRSVLVPLLHDEKAMYLPVFHQVFRAAGAILFNTTSERRLAARLYGLDTSHMVVAGVGIDAEAPSAQQQAEVRRKYAIETAYMIYVGRIDRAKGCRELLDAFAAWAADEPAARLVLVGQAVMRIEPDPRIVLTGFVAEDERDALIAGAAALVIPSRYESLSLVTLEAMKFGVPVIANAACDVLEEHIRESGAGLAYHGTRELVEAMHHMLALGADERARLGAAGQRYVHDRYTWPRVIQQVSDAVYRVADAGETTDRALDHAIP